jgi:hypothetical protein
VTYILLVILVLLGLGCSRADQPDAAEALLQRLVRETMVAVSENSDASSPPASIATAIVDRHTTEVVDYVRQRTHAEASPDIIASVRQMLISGLVSAINDQRSGRLRSPPGTGPRSPAPSVPIPTSRAEAIEQVLRGMTLRSTAHSDALRAIIGNILAELGGNQPIDDQLWANAQRLAAEIVDRHRAEIEHYVLQTIKQNQESVQMTRNQLVRGVTTSLENLRERRERVDRMAKTIDASIPALAVKAVSSSPDPSAAAEQVLLGLRVLIASHTSEREAYLRTLAAYQGDTASIELSIRVRNEQYLSTLRMIVDDEVAANWARRPTTQGP